MPDTVVVGGTGVQPGAADIAGAPAVLVRGDVGSEAAAALTARVEAGKATWFIASAGVAAGCVVRFAAAKAAAAAAIPAQWVTIEEADPRSALLKQPGGAVYIPAAPGTPEVLKAIPVGCVGATATLASGETVVVYLEDRKAGGRVVFSQFDPEGCPAGVSLLKKWKGLKAPAAFAAEARAPRMHNVVAVVRTDAAVAGEVTADALAAAGADSVVVLGEGPAAGEKFAALQSNTVGLPVAHCVNDAALEAALPLHAVRAVVTDAGLSSVAEAKGRLVYTSAVGAVAVRPSGMQYGSHNLQCVVPILPVRAGQTPEDLQALVDTYGIVGDFAVDLRWKEEGAFAVLKPFLKNHNIRVHLAENDSIPPVDEMMQIMNEGAAKVAFQFPGAEDDDDVAGAAAPTMEREAEFLAQLPRDRVIVVLPCRLGAAGAAARARRLLEIRAIAEVAGHIELAFAAADVQAEYFPLAYVREAAQVCKEAKVALAVSGAGCAAAGVFAVCDEMGVEVTVPSASLPAVADSADGDALSVASCITAILKTDRVDGLYPTVVVDSENQRALGMCYSSKQSVAEAVKRQRGVYWSRGRGLWVKGETSGDTQRLVAVGLDCDRDCLRFVVDQTGAGFCHRSQQSCFAPASGFDKLLATLRSRRENAPAGSYTKRLFDDAKLLKCKLMEEAEELADSHSQENTAFEAADLIYFALTRCVAMDTGMREIQRNLDFKNRKVHRRKGDAKPHFERIVNGK